MQTIGFLNLIKMYKFNTVLLWALAIIGSQNAKAQNLKGEIDTLRKEAKIPGLAYAVFKSNRVLTMEVCGSRRSDVYEPLMLQDKFHLGSNTKAVTSFIAAKLVEDGKIGWQTSFFQVFPKLKEKSLPEYYDITLQELLSHRAGILPFTSGLEQKKVPSLKGSTPEKWRQFAEWLLQQPPLKIKKDAFSMAQYSNAGYVLAALMLEEVTKKTWATLATETLGKLDAKVLVGFPNKSNVHQPWGHRTGLAWGMGDNYVEPAKPTDEYNLDLIAPAGDLSMAMPDYVKFLQEQLKGLSGKNSMLTAPSVLFMHNGLPQYSLGWGNTVVKDRRVSYHDGSAGTFYCHVIMLQDSDLGIVVMTNIAGRKAEKAIYQIREKLAAQYK